MVYVMNGDELYHHGIKGQKWGIRRYQNADGSLTAAGKKRYSDSDATDSNGSVKRKGLSDGQKTALKAGAIALAVGLSAYGAYKLNQKATASLVDSYSQVGEIFTQSFLNNDKVALDRLDYADRARLRGSDDTKNLMLNSAKYHEKMAKIDASEAKRLNTKANSRNFSAKERANAAVNIMTRGNNSFKEMKTREIFSESMSRTNDERRKARG